MRKNCSVCVHPKRAEIDAALVAGRSLRDISGQHGTSKSALDRHRREHLGGAIQRGKELAEKRVVRAVAKREVSADLRSLDLVEQLALVVAPLEKLVRAVDEELTDPDDPERYNLGPRSTEIDVVYLESVGKSAKGTPIIVRKKRRLQHLLDDIAEQKPSWVGWVEVKWKVADPRKLVGDLARTFRIVQEHLAKLRALSGAGTPNLVVDLRPIEMREPREVSGG